jgi:hypothetical protein
MDGTYTASHRIGQSGPYTLQLTAKGSPDPLVRHGRCLPAPTSVPNTRVDSEGLKLAQRYVPPLWHGACCAAPVYDACMDA